MFQLHAIREFLRRCEIPPSLTLPLGELLAALGDAERGTANPLLTPRRKETAGRAPPKLAADRYRATAAVGLELLMRSRIKEGVAAKQVITRLKRATISVFTAASDAKAASALKTLRDRLNAGTAEASSFYRRRLREVQNMPPAQAADWIIDGMIAILGKKTS